MAERSEDETAAARVRLTAAARTAMRAGRTAVRAGAVVMRAGAVAVRAVVRWLRGRSGHRLGVGLAIFGVSVAGVILGVLLGAHTGSNVGPFRAELSLTPSVRGGTEVIVPPLGSLHLNSHEGPAHLSIRLGALDQRRTRALINDPNGIARASRTAVDDVAGGVVRLGLRTLGAAVLSALLLAALIFRNMRRVAWTGCVALAVTAGSLGVAAATFRVGAIQEPRYEGLLVNAPAVVGDAKRIANRYDEYAAQLQGLVTNVSRLYTTVSTLPVFQPEAGTIHVLHISDIHLNPTAWSVIQTVVEQFDIDLVIDTGDITDWGTEPEAAFVGSIARLRVPYVYIRGNHDSATTAARVAGQPNAVVLDNSVRTVAGLAIAGIGDPRFTPDKDTSPATGRVPQQTIERVIGAGEQVATTIRAAGRPVDIALVHDPTSAGPLSGTSPLVLAGHTHARAVTVLPRIPNGVPSLLLVEGSTGGAGLRGLQKKEPVPLEMSVLYFDRDHKLKAYDDITVGGTGQAQVTLNRHLAENIEPQVKKAPTPGR